MVKDKKEKYDICQGFVLEKEAESNPYIWNLRHKMPQKILFLLFFLSLFGSRTTALYSQQNLEFHRGAIIRGDTARNQLALVFTGHEFAEGGQEIMKTLEQQDSKASFFFTGHFYRNPAFSDLIASLVEEGHYLGAHSDKHLLYCDWSKRDSLLVNRAEFTKDLLDNYKEMEKFGVKKEDVPFFLPPYEWYNDSISAWTRNLDLQLINFTHGTLSHADYTTPSMPGYRSSRTIYESILTYEKAHPSGLNGFILLVHIGAGPGREDKFYLMLDELMKELKKMDYQFVRIDELLK